MKQNINQDIAMAIFNSTDKPSQSRNIVSLREKVEAYANKRVLNELEVRLKEINTLGFASATMNLQKRISELKQ